MEVNQNSSLNLLTKKKTIITSNLFDITIIIPVHLIFVMRKTKHFSRTLNVLKLKVLEAFKPLPLLQFVDFRPSILLVGPFQLPADSRTSRAGGLPDFLRQLPVSDDCFTCGKQGQSSPFSLSFVICVPE